MSKQYETVIGLEVHVDTVEPLMKRGFEMFYSAP